MIVPYAARSTFDVLGRIMAVRMGELLGQTVIVENTTGAGGIISVQAGNQHQTGWLHVLLGTVGTHAYDQTMYRKRRYDAINDLAPSLYSPSSRWCWRCARICRPIPCRSSPRC